ncbi:MAG: hypothetical protein EA412_06790 [Chitinophagaceae bacterium]|nr:MAG: hypothetical protein EA412_06790 [Chitinophagaceae bacterium]
MKIIYFVIISISVSFYACSSIENNNESEAVGSGGWLKGSTLEKFDEITNHLGGFSAAMKEVNYRFGELYWAGIDENWEYAIYQLEHLEEAIEYGITRRPGRATSSEDFLNTSIPQLQKVLESKNAENFDHQMKLFIAACNSCHIKEDVEFIYVVQPESRFSYVRKNPNL